jgi:hypothetical protein
MSIKLKHAEFDLTLTTDVSFGTRVDEYPATKDDLGTDVSKGTTYPSTSE